MIIAAEVVSGLFYLVLSVVNLFSIERFNMPARQYEKVGLWQFPIFRSCGAGFGQNGHTERLIRSIRWECLDHVVIFGERNLRDILLVLYEYYNSADLSLSELAGCSGRRAHSPDTHSRRITPSLCSDLISDMDSGISSISPEASKIAIAAGVWARSGRACGASFHSSR